MDMQTGRIVFSKAGRDKKKAFVIVKDEGEYVYLADGSMRVLSKPKKKKIKHLQPTNIIDEDIKNKLETGKLLDSDLRGALKILDKAERVNE